MRNGHNGAPVRGLKLKLLVLLVLCALPIGGSVSVLLTGGSPLPLLAYAVVSLLAFGLLARDGVFVLLGFLAIGGVVTLVLTLMP